MSSAFSNKSKLPEALAKGWEGNPSHSWLNHSHVIQGMLHTGSESKPCWAASHWQQKASWQNPSYVITVILQLKRCKLELCLQWANSDGWILTCAAYRGGEEGGRWQGLTTPVQDWFSTGIAQDKALAYTNYQKKSIAATPFRKQAWDWSITVFIEQCFSFFLAEDHCIHTRVAHDNCLSHTRRVVWRKNILGAFIQ